MGRRIPDRFNYVTRVHTRDNSVAARKTGQRIIECADLLVDQPFLGAPGRIHKTRELVVSKTPYTIIYYASVDVISILRVFHQSQKWPKVEGDSVKKT